MRLFLVDFLKKVQKRFKNILCTRKKVIQLELMDFELEITIKKNIQQRLFQLISRKDLVLS